MTDELRQKIESALDLRVYEYASGQVTYFDAARPGLHPGSSSGSRYLYLGSDQKGQRTPTVDRNPFHTATERERRVRQELARTREMFGIIKDDDLPDNLVPPVRRRKSTVVAGFVYFIWDEESCAVKIGESETYPEGRLLAFQTGNPRNLELVHAFYSTDRVAAERALHAKYAKFHVRGEWFSDVVLTLEGIA